MVFANRFDKGALWAHGVGAAVVALSAALAACEGCRTTQGGTGPSSSTSAGSAASAADAPPSVRVYFTSDFAGALEPCGCTKDQLGGLDHAAAWMRAQQPKAPNALLVSAGPLFFMEPTLKPDHVAQDVAKAETIARGLKTLGFAAFSPGINDWAAGGDELAKLQAVSGGSLLYANVAGAAGPIGKWVVRDVGGVKVGLVGVSAAGEQPQAKGLGLQTSPPVDAIKLGLDAAKKDGALMTIALASLGRGDAKRLADLVPGLTAIVVGSPGGSGDLNTPASPPERLGDVLVLQMGNHLTTVGVLDLFVRDGSFAFADATGIEKGQKREELRRRIDELRGKIAGWEGDPAVKKDDLDARRAEVTKLEADLKALDATAAPPKGSFFRYAVQEVRDALGSDAQVKSAIDAYYKDVNDRNKVAFADRMPPAAAAGQPTYTGVEACTKCHKEEREFWDSTRHSKAYKTLADQNKQFNLDCVSCHVTGYDEPGGSSVTHVAGLESVQCEICHGPGSKHGADPKHVPPPTKKPNGDLCLKCHHPPHVEGFDAEKKMADIIGPGHGL
jgi:2',3'-cyclic-nucleotide 2'-phosphodiesterase (5'-nucleotidase family)